jgi:hypothetical protein
MSGFNKLRCSDGNEVSRTNPGNESPTLFLIATHLLELADHAQQA